MEVEYVIVQAGGKGTRLEHLTVNKPKALVPIQNLPMVFYLFKKFPDKKFVIIGDYHYQVLHDYLECFADVEYLLVNAEGRKGTCAGVKQALNLIPDNKSFMLIWSDLILSETFTLPTEDLNYIGLSGDFPCRWKYEDLRFSEEASIERGVAGLFVFRNKKQICDIPLEGEFVRWLQQTDLNFSEIILSKTKEYGLLSEYNKIPVSKCRPFNNMIVNDDKIIKEGIDEQGKRLSIKEKNWYKHVEELNFPYIPKIYSYEPLIMEKINGKNIYEYYGTVGEKRTIIAAIVATLQQLHNMERKSPDFYSMHENYVSKTFERIDKVRTLIPFANDPEIMINGKRCRNVFYHRSELENLLNTLPVNEFCLLHGDCTFSNMMLRNDREPVLIDPRGYFGHTWLYGDVAYDWAKLYYSIVGNYDQFNLKRFVLTIMDSGITLNIESNGFEEIEDYFLELIKDEVSEQNIKLIHAVIWLSLTTYAWEDYDSICGAFYNGLYYLEEVL